MASFSRSPCCRQFEAAGYLASRHVCEWHSDKNPEQLRPFLLSRRIPQANAHHVSFKWRDHEFLDLNTDLGSLGVFSLEVLHQILHQLDIGSLARLQCASQGMKRAVGSLPMLRALLDFDPAIIRGIAATKTGSLIVCRELYDKFCSRVCDTCDEAGTYLYLLTCKRVCAQCLTQTYQYRPMRPLQAKTWYGVNNETLRRLPGLTVPTYRTRCGAARSSNSSFYYRIPKVTGWRLIDQTALMKASMRKYGSFFRITDQRFSKTLEAFRRVWMRIGRVGTARWNIGTQYKMAGVETSLACATEFQWFDRNSGTTGVPMRCVACLGSGTERWYYTKGGFEEHEKTKGKVINATHRPDLLE